MYQKKRINALYCRVSTDGQQTGLESQIRALKDWCVRNQIAEYELFADEGISGAKESRPALNRLMQMVENDEVEQIIVFSSSRLLVFAVCEIHKSLIKGTSKVQRKEHSIYFNHRKYRHQFSIRSGPLYNSWSFGSARTRNDHRARTRRNGKRKSKGKEDWQNEAEEFGADSLPFRG